MLKNAGELSLELETCVKNYARKPAACWASSDVNSGTSPSRKTFMMRPTSHRTLGTALGKRRRSSTRCATRVARTSESRFFSQKTSSPMIPQAAWSGDVGSEYVSGSSLIFAHASFASTKQPTQSCEQNESMELSPKLRHETRLKKFR